MGEDAEWVHLNVRDIGWKDFKSYVFIVLNISVSAETGLTLSTTVWKARQSNGQLEVLMERDRDQQNRDSSQLQNKIVCVLHGHKHTWFFYDPVFRENGVLRVEANVGFVATYHTERNNEGL